jgi:glycerol-3-phosphate dehydrogenase
MRETTERIFDIIVIGGGITGAGVARDASLRGLSCLLLEKDDFASGATSKTTRLIHGGLRYLANFEVDLVAESLRERAILRKLASHLIRPVPILIPIYKGDAHGRAVISVGIHLYDLLSREKDIPHYFTSGRERTLAFEPRLEQNGLKGSALFYDHQIEMPERLVIENIVSSKQHGAKAMNHMRVVRIEPHGSAVLVEAIDQRDASRQSFQGRSVVNAAGPWIDEVRKLGDTSSKDIMHPTKGAHLVVPRLNDQALFVMSRDNRMFFIIPFGASSLIGTTDTRFDGDLDDVHADVPDIDYLIAESSRVMPGLKLNRNMIQYTYAGIRPLAFSGSRESKISRKHRLLSEGAGKRLITIGGGKLTTYRNMAKDAVDAACKVLGRHVGCDSDVRPLPGSLPAEPAVFADEAAPDLADRFRVSDACVRNLISTYGVRVIDVLDLLRDDSALGKRISPECEDIYAQVVFSIREEQAASLTDIVLRRMKLGAAASRGAEEIETIAEIAGRELKWNRDERTHQVQNFIAELSKDRVSS